jgi:hypothetical protein
LTARGFAGISFCFAAGVAADNKEFFVTNQRPEELLTVSIPKPPGL